MVLLDEIEKAHRDVFNILLQVLDDGRLTDSHGHTVDFTNTIIVMTSNIGSQMIQEIVEAGGTHEEMRSGVMESLQTRFLPEFLNRIDEMIVFHPLDRVADPQDRRPANRAAGEAARTARLRPGSDRRSARRNRQPRLRPGVRRPAAEARDPAGAAKPAGDGTAQRRVTPKAARSASTSTATSSRSPQPAAATAHRAREPKRGDKIVSAERLQ